MYKTANASFRYPHYREDVLPVVFIRQWKCGSQILKNLSATTSKRNRAQKCKRLLEVLRYLQVVRSSIKVKHSHWALVEGVHPWSRIITGDNNNNSDDDDDDKRPRKNVYAEQAHSKDTLRKADAGSVGNICGARLVATHLHTPASRLDLRTRAALSTTF